MHYAIAISEGDKRVIVFLAIEKSISSIMSLGDKNSSSLWVAKLSADLF